MSCALCAITTPGQASELCGHHLTGDAAWALANRVFCDLLHRGIGPPPVVFVDPPVVEWSDVA